MKNNILILCDTRQQKDKHITDYFDKHHIVWQRATLPNCGDYMAIKYSTANGMMKDYSILIDTKQDLLELVGNLCNRSEHERLRREVMHAREIGCKEFIFLITDNNIKKVDDIINWKNKYSKVKGETLIKIMKTFKERYGVKFMFCTKQTAGKIIYNLLTKI